MQDLNLRQLRCKGKPPLQTRAFLPLPYGDLANLSRSAPGDWFIRNQPNLSGDFGLHDPLLAAQFWKFVDVRGEGVCWFWRGAKNNGYGRFRGIRAHRFAYEIAKDQIPSELVVRHLCGNKLCVNPRHLDVGTHADNARDGMELGEILRGSANGKAKLTEEEVAYIRLNPDNLSGVNLATKFKVSPATISLIRSGRRWGHYAPPPEWTGEEAA